MALSTISSGSFGIPWPSAWGTSGTLKIIVSNVTFVFGGKTYVQGRVSDPVNQRWCVQSAISVAGGVGTFASFSLPQTDVGITVINGSAIPRFTGIYYDSKGVKRGILFQDWHLSSSLTTSFNFEAWAVDNAAATVVNPRTDFLGADGVNNAITARLNAPAQTTLLGLVKTSVAAADLTNPIAVGDNDPRVAAGSPTNRGTVRTTTTTSVAVSDDDFRLPTSPAFVWADRFVSLTAALSYCASTYPTGATLVVSTDITQAGDISIPVTVTLFFTNAGRLSVVSGTTFVRAGIIGGLRKIFNLSGSGAISFNANTSVPVQYPQWFGATGDGSTDDTTAINQAIDAFNTGTGGVLEFGRGVFKVTGALHAITADGIIQGQGQSHSDSSQADAATKINCTSQSAVLFTVNSLSFKFRDLAIFNTFAGTPSSTSTGIKVTNGSNNSQKVDYDSITVWGFYYNVDVQVGGYWKMDNCLLIGPVQTALRINNTVNADAGDWSIVNTFISGLTYDAGPAIQINGSGGGKIVNLKINGYLHYFTDGIQVNPATTGILLVSNSSIENVTGHGIIVTGDVLGSSWYFVNLDNIEIDIVPVVANTKNAVHLTKVTGVNIDNLHVRGNNVSGVSAILLDNCSNVNIPETVSANTDFGRIVQITNGYSGYLLPFEDTVALTISSNTLTPLFRTSSVSGGGLLKTISTPVYSTERRTVAVTLIPLSNFTYDATGNIAAGGSGTATAGRAITFTYLPTQDKFYPSY